jgi:putative NADH-flavin reductase
MRIFLAGAAGVLGRSLISHLRGDDVVGLTRSADKAASLRELGVQPVIADAYDRQRLVRVVVEARPDVVVNFLTDLSDRSLEANARLRREVGPAIVDAAEAASARRIVVESIAWRLDGAAGEAVSLLETSALDSPLDALVIRFGRLWGPSTWYPKPPDPPRVHIDDGGRRAAELIAAGATGIEVVA